MRVVSIFRKYVLRNRKGFLFFLVLNTTAMVLSVAAPQFIARLIDDITKRNVAGLLFTAGLLLACKLGSGLAAYVSANLSYQLVADAYLRFNYDLMSFVERLPLSFFRGRDAVYVSSQLYDDTQEIVSFIINNITNILIDVFTLSAILVLLLVQTSASSAAIFASAVLLDMVLYAVFKGKLFALSLELKVAQNHFFSFLTDHILKIEFVKVHVLYAFLKSLALKKFDDLSGIVRRHGRAESGYLASGKLLREFAVLAALIVGAFDVLNDKLTVGTLIALIAYYELGFASVANLYRVGKEWQSASAALVRIRDIVSETPERIHGARIADVSEIVLDRVTFGYESTPLMQNLSYRFKKGTISVLKGMNGCGKSTLCRLLLGLETPQSGAVFYDGHNINDLDIDNLRQNIVAYMGQKPMVINGSPASNVLFSEEHDPQALARMREVLDKTGLAHFYETISNREGPLESSLSGGELQKLSLLRCLCRNLPVLLLDEPTASLDRDSLPQLREYLRSVGKNTIILIVAHGDVFDDIADQCLSLKE